MVDTFCRYSHKAEEIVKGYATGLQNLKRFESTYETELDMESSLHPKEVVDYVKNHMKAYIKNYREELHKYIPLSFTKTYHGVPGYRAYHEHYTEMKKALENGIAEYDKRKRNQPTPLQDMEKKLQKLQKEYNGLQNRFDKAKGEYDANLRAEKAMLKRNNDAIIQKSVEEKIKPRIEEELRSQKSTFTKAMGEIESEYKSFINELKRNQEETQRLHEQKIRLLEEQLKETVATYETLFAKKHKEEIEKRAKEIAAEYLKKEFPFE